MKRVPKVFCVVEYRGHDGALDRQIHKVRKMYKGSDQGSGFCFIDGARDISVSVPTNKLKRFARSISCVAVRNDVKLKMTVYTKDKAKLISTKHSNLRVRQEVPL